MCKSTFISIGLIRKKALWQPIMHHYLSNSKSPSDGFTTQRNNYVLIAVCLGVIDGFNPSEALVLLPLCALMKNPIEMCACWTCSEGIGPKRHTNAIQRHRAPWEWSQFTSTAVNETCFPLISHFFISGKLTSISWRCWNMNFKTYITSAMNINVIQAISSILLPKLIKSN